MEPSTKIREQLQEKRADAQKAWEKFEPFQKRIANGDLSPLNDKDTFAEATKANGEYQAIAAECKTLEEAYGNALTMDGKGIGDSPFAGLEAKGEDGLAYKSAGERVVESEHYKQLVGSGALDSQNAAFRMSVKALSRSEHAALLRSRFDMKTLMQSVGEPGATLLRPQRLPGYLDLLQAPLKLRNLITVGETDSNTVEWVRMLEISNNAREVEEATATSGVSGTKPESGFTFELQNTVVQTIAHWIPATRNSLADVAQLRTIIDSQLLDGVARRLNTQILKGDGLGSNLKGILAQPIQAQDDTVLAAGDRKIERILGAITKIRLAFMEPTAVLMHPLDAMEIRLTKDENLNYQFGPPSQVGEARVWGLPIIEDTTVDQGEPIVGDWSQAILYVREDVNVLASDSHADFFVRNMIVVLGEARYALAVPRPDAFCTVDFETAEA